MEEVIIMVGLPGAGKTTWSNKHNETHVLILDANNTTPTERLPFISIALANGLPVRAVYVLTGVDECVERSKHVDAEVIYTMHEYLVKPSVKEGFTSCKTVMGY